MNMKRESLEINTETTGMLKLCDRQFGATIIKSVRLATTDTPGRNGKREELRIEIDVIKRNQIEI